MENVRKSPQGKVSYNVAPPSEKPVETVANARQNCLALPYAATTKRKAEMFADAIGALFCPDIETEVFEYGGKWAVSIVKGMAQIGDPMNNQIIIAAATLLMVFDLAKGTGGIECIAESLEEIPAAHKAEHLSGAAKAADAHTLPVPKLSPASKRKVFSAGALRMTTHRPQQTFDEWCAEQQVLLKRQLAKINRFFGQQLRIVHPQSGSHRLSERPSRMAQTGK